MSRHSTHERGSVSAQRTADFTLRLWLCNTFLLEGVLSRKELNLELQEQGTVGVSSEHDCKNRVKKCEVLTSVLIHLMFSLLPFLTIRTVS
jgi:hypothetical protein